MAQRPIVVIGAGIGGLTAALDLAVAGYAVEVFERAAEPGGKLRREPVGKAVLDAGPTVFTMRNVFESIFADAGADLATELPLRKADILARHSWEGGARLDLFADPAASRDAIGTLAGAEQARLFDGFLARARGIHDTLKDSFIEASRPSPTALVGRVGIAGLGGLWRISPFATLWQALGEYFPDPRLRQLFGRYATYCGSSPFTCPATLMLVAHVEQEGVWLVEGGMHRIAQALQRLGERHGVRFRFEAPVAAIETASGAASAIVLADGERIATDAIVFNGDVSALAGGLLGQAARPAASAVAPSERSLSAVTWCLEAEAEGFPLVRHNVFFAGDYKAEFDAIFRRRELPIWPTVYVCAQDRDDTDGPNTAIAAGRPERLFCLINAPADGDRRTFSEAEITACAMQAFGLLERQGLRIRARPEATTITQPADFARRFPGTGGALYGRASHGWMASFARPGSASRIPGLYLAGGSVHPGPGVPMAALSGRLAARAIVSDRASTRMSRPAAMPGGMSMR